MDIQLRFLYSEFNKVNIKCCKLLLNIWKPNNKNRRKEQTNANSMDSLQAYARLNYPHNNIQH